MSPILIPHPSLPVYKVWENLYRDKFHDEKELESVLASRVRWKERRGRVKNWNTDDIWFSFDSEGKRRLRWECE